MAQLIFSGVEIPVPISKKLFSVGGKNHHDYRVLGFKQDLLFSLVTDQTGRVQVSGADVKLKINGKPLSGVVTLRSCDRIEWNGGEAIFLESKTRDESSEDADIQNKILKLLETLTQWVQEPLGVDWALKSALEGIADICGAQNALLLSEDLKHSEWRVLATASSQVESSKVLRQEIFSNTILNESIQTREPVILESIIGHPWASAKSVVAAKIFSAASLPLVFNQRVCGAIFLTTHEPGRSIKKESLVAVKVLASQLALLLNSNLTVGTHSNANKSVVQTLSGMVWHPSTQSMQDLMNRIEKVAKSNISVLIHGETGTGKELVAKEIHLRSQRNTQTFVAINCAAIPGTLIESTLFGFEKGAFTGANRAQAGKFKLADRGTLFLDEIAELPLEIQAKLLRVLQTSEIDVIGGREPIRIDVRIIAATHQNLKEKVSQGLFREDLFYRLNGVSLEPKPLRERECDIEFLANHFLSRLDETLRLSESALRALKAYRFQGNIRELQQIIQRASVLCTKPEIVDEDLGLDLSQSNHSDSLSGKQPESSGARWEMNRMEGLSLDAARDSFIQGLVSQVLSQTQGNRAEAAKKLQISERTLYRILSE